MTALDAQSRKVLNEQAALGGRPLRAAPVADSRAVQWGWVPYMGEPTPLASVADRFIASSTAEIPIRVYTPSGEGPFAAIVAFHGGCWIVGNIDVADAVHRSLAATTGCVVVAVNYQKAPEHRFPIPLDDCYAGLQWTRAHAHALNIDSTRIAVGGDSAGGNLAAAVCLRARDRGEPQPAAQVLIYPALDPALDTNSARDFYEGFGLSTEDMRWSWHEYVAEDALLDEPTVAPARATDLSGLAPAIVVTAGYDILRDEDLAYFRRLVDAGNPAVNLHYPTTIHGFLWMRGAVDACDEMLADVSTALHAIWKSR